MHQKGNHPIGRNALCFKTGPMNRRFAFGTWKIEILGGFASALFLLGVALLMVVGSTERLFSPKPIAYRESVQRGESEKKE